MTKYLKFVKKKESQKLLSCEKMFSLKICKNLNEVTVWCCINARKFSSFKIDSIYPKTHSGVYCEYAIRSALLFPFGRRTFQPAGSTLFGSV